MVEDDYEFTPPELGGLGQEHSLFPPSAEAAYMLQLIKINLDATSLPDDVKKNFIIDMLPLLNNASMTKITRGQVKEFYGGYKEICVRFRIFKVSKKYHREFNYATALIREIIIQNLNKSVEGWQGDHVFEKKATYDIRQSRRDISEKIKGVLGRKKKIQREVVEEDIA